MRAIGAGSNRHLVSTAGGLSPRWRRDSQELYYLATASTMLFGATVPDGRLMAVTISPDGRPGIPTPLFSVRARGSRSGSEGRQALPGQCRGPQRPAAHHSRPELDEIGYDDSSTISRWRGHRRLLSHAPNHVNRTHKW